MPEYQYDAMISVAVSITAPSDAEAREAVENAVNETLFATGVVQMNDSPMIDNMVLLSVDGKAVEANEKE